MRVAIGGIYHESNSFAASPTILADVRAGGIETGEAMLDRWRGTNNEIGGFIGAAERHGWDLVPALSAWIMPSGPLTADALDTLCTDLCSRIPSDVDGVLLMVHGAMVSESSDDPDAVWTRRVRDHVGDSVPIVATADFHGNITPEMLAPLNGLIGYDTYPHTDYRERAEEAGDLLHRIMTEGIRPTMRLVQVPVIPHLLTQFTGSGPMNRLMEAARREERRTDALWASVFGGFAWADVPHNGLSIVVGTNDDPEGAAELALALAKLGWSHRSRFLSADTLEPHDAVAEAIEEPNGPVVLVDTGDNVGGGTPGDYPTLLREMIEQGARDAVILIADPETVGRAREVGVRNEARFSLGGKVDSRYGVPVEVTCRVRALFEGVYRNVGEMRDGIVDDMGLTAVLEHAGITIVATTRKMPMWNLQQLRTLGIEPTRQHIIVVKAAIAHRAAYSPIAARMIDVSSPGITALDVRRFDYTRLRRPVLPLDTEVTYSPSAL